jgi:hypothetical protein
MKKIKSTIFAIVALALFASCSSKYTGKKEACKDCYKGYETLSYKVVKKDNNFEIRQYSSYTAAEVKVYGERKKAAKKGFMQLADYIFGGNQDKKKIAMTSPVIQYEESAKNWVVQFATPKEYKMNKLPKADNKQIAFKNISGGKFVVITFSGFWSDSNFEKKKVELDQFIAKNKLKAKGSKIIAYYDHPYTMPWNRRNEILQQVR